MTETKQQAQKQERFDGFVKWFKPRRGFGFITPCDETKEDLFVHQSEIISRGYRTLFDGDFVEYSVREDPQGRLMASQVVFRGRKVQAGQGACYTCGQLGHFARDCTKLTNSGGDNNGNGNNGENVKRSDQECYNCGVIGHFARDCKEGRRFINGGNNGGEYSTRRRDTCYNCGKIGHYARDCRTVLKN